MAVKLRVIEGHNVGTVYFLGDGESKVFGRHTSADVVIPDPLLSRHHLMVRGCKGGAVILDLESSNGTFLNDRLVKEAPVEHGDRVKLGHQVFEVEIEQKAARTAVATDHVDTVRVLQFCSRCRKAVSDERPGLPPWEPYVCEECRRGHSAFDPYVVEGWTLVEKIGDGVHGPIYRAERETPPHRALVKLIAPGKGVDAAILDMFVREAAIGRRLAHPAIVRMLDAGERRGVYYILEEWIEGCDLLRRIQERRALPPDELLAIAARVAEALAFAAQQGIVHRNVNPASIFLPVSPPGAVKLGDFGLAKIVSGPSPASSGIMKAGEWRGVLNYVAPEQLINAAAADHRADVYALGATMYHMACGRPPYEAPSPLRVIRRIGEGDLDPLSSAAPGLPKVVRAVIERAMEREVGRRYPSPAEMLHAIEEADRLLRSGA